MFERVKNWFKRKGARVGLGKELNHITDHELIGIDEKETYRIEANKRIYSNTFDNIEYLNSEGVVKKRPFRGLNVSKVVSRELSKLIFNEGVTIEIESKYESYISGYINDIFDDTDFQTNFGAELEAGYAIGGLAIRPYVDNDKVKLSYAQADSFFPLESNANEVNECAFTFKDVVRENETTLYYTLFEFHQMINGVYTVTNELYESEKKEKIGVKVALSTLDKYEDLEEVTTMENISRPMFIYIKLAGKNNLSLNSPLSLGIIDNSKQQFKDINEKYDQFMWEVKKAERKIIASDHFFKTKYDSDTGRPVKRFADDTDVFQRFQGDMDDMTIQEYSPQLRSTEFIETIDFILRIIEMQTGFSAGTFSFDGQSVKTATEVVSENSRTYSTRQDNVLIIEKAIKQLVVSILELSELYDLIPKVEYDKLHINITFDDGVFESKEAKLQYYGNAVTLNLMPKIVAMQRAYGISEEEAVKWYNLTNYELRGEDIVEIGQQNYESQFGSEE